MTLFLRAAFHLYTAIVQNIQMLFWWVAQILNLHSILLKPFPNFQFKSSLKGYVAYLIYCHQPLRFFKRSFEYKVFNYIYENISDGDIAVDVGANVGMVSLFMSSIVGKKGRVFAIEASNRNSKVLNKNIEINNIENITVINYAVSDSEKEIFMKSPKGDNNDALLTMTNDTDDGFGEPSVSLTFDKIVEMWSIKNVKLIKIDIEGAELLFFKGAENFFKGNKPFLIFETLDIYCERFGYSSIDVLVMVYSWGYKVKQLDIETWVAYP